MQPESSEEDDEEEYAAALSCDLLFSAKLPSTLPFPTGKVREALPQKAGKPATTNITTATWCRTKARLYVGLSNGDLCFWSLERDGATQLRYVGSHRGPVTCICLPKKADGELGASGLILTGSVDGNIKIWDYQGKVGSQPTVCVQTLYGHQGTITGLFTYDQYILSSSTDKTVKVWKAVQGREQLVYPWYNLQATPVTLSAWVRCMSYDRGREVGDLGSFFAADESGGIVRILPYTMHDLEDRTNKDLVFSVPGASHASLYSSGSTLAGGGPEAVPHAIPVTHDRGVLHVRYVADWHLLLTLCYDNCLRCYDSDTGEVKHTWSNENRCLFLDLEVDVENKEVLAVDQQGVLSVFSLKAGGLLATRTVAVTKVVKIVAVLGRHTYAIMTDRELSVWHLNHQLDYNLLRGGHTRAVISLYACTGGAGAQPHDKDYRIFSAGMDNTVRLWDPYDMACVRVHGEAHSEITAMTCYEAWNILVTGHDNGDIRLWDLDTGPWCTLQQHTNSVTSLVLAVMRKNEELLISGGYDGMIVLWDIRTLRNEPPHMIGKFRAHGLEPGRAPASMAAAARAATTSPLLGAGGTFGDSPALPDALQSLIPALTLAGPDDEVVETAAETDNASASLRPGLSSSASTGSSSFKIGSTSNRTRIGNFTSQKGNAGAAHIGNTSARSLEGSAGGLHQTICVTAGTDGAGGGASRGSGVEPPRPLDVLLARSRAAAAVRDREEAAAALATAAAGGGPDGQRDEGRSVVPEGPYRGRMGPHPAGIAPPGGGTQDGGSEAMADLLGLEPEVLVVQFDVNKKVIITGGNDHIIKVWSSNGYTQLGQHLGHTDAVCSMALDANLLFSGSEDCTIRVWDTVPAPTHTPKAQAAAGGPRGSEPPLAFTGSALKVLHGHTRCVTGMELAARGGQLLSCSLDGSLRLWDYVSGTTLAKFTHHEEMRCLTLRTDKQEVLVGTNQASILRYSIDEVMAAGLPGSGVIPGLGLDFPTEEGMLAHLNGEEGLQQPSHRSRKSQDRNSCVGSVFHSGQPLGTPDPYGATTPDGLTNPTLPSASVTGSRLSTALSSNLTTNRSGGQLQNRLSTAQSTGTTSTRPGGQLTSAGSNGSQPNTVVNANQKPTSQGDAWEGVVSKGKVFGGGGAGGPSPDPWRWGAAKVQLLPKEPPKLSAVEMLAALDRQSGSPGLKPGGRSR